MRARRNEEFQASRNIDQESRALVEAHEIGAQPIARPNAAMRRRSALNDGQRKMNEARIKELVEELDRIVPKEGASVSFRQYGGGPDESKIVGSRTGLLRAGVSLLRAGVAPPGEKKEIGDLSDLGAITHSESEYRFDYFEESALPEDRAAEEKNHRVAKRIGYGLLAVVLLTVGFALYGVARLFY